MHRRLQAERQVQSQVILPNRLLNLRRRRLRLGSEKERRRRRLRRLDGDHALGLLALAVDNVDRLRLVAHRRLVARRPVQLRHVSAVPRPLRASRVLPGGAEAGLPCLGLDDGGTCSLEPAPGLDLLRVIGGRGVLIFGHVADVVRLERRALGARGGFRRDRRDRRAFENGFHSGLAEMPAP